MCRRMLPVKTLLKFLAPILLLAVLFSLILNQIVYAADIIVTNTNDSGPGSLRQAIADAASGDTIAFDDSLTGETITLTSGSLSISGKDIAINGPGAENLTISGNSATRVFTIRGNAGATISGLTIADGYTVLIKGGGIYNLGALTLEDSVVSGNETDTSFGTFYLSGGAGIYNAGTLIVRNSIISDNGDQSFSNGGGGIYNEGDMTLENSTVANNAVQGNSVMGIYGGGGIFNSGSGSIVNSIISGNSAAGYTTGGGGGIYNDGSLSIAYTTISNNSTIETFGAGILNWTNGNMHIEHSTITGNSSGADGGGIENVGMLTAAHTTVSYNQAHSTQYGGGGIDNTDGTLTLINSTVSNNSAASYGGGLLIYDGNMTLIYTTVSDNSAATGGGIYLTGEITTTAVFLTNSIIANTASGEDCFIETGNITHVNSLIEDSSCGPTLSGDPLLGPLQDNGGSTQTHALLPGSPAIDQASCTDVTIDQPGNPRPIDVPVVPDLDGGCDIGAYELQDISNYPTPTPTATPSPTSTPLPEPTETPQPTATETPQPTATNTPPPTATDTPLPTATNTPQPTATETSFPTATNTPQPTATETPSPTPTNTPFPTATNTQLPTATNTPQLTATGTPSPTSTHTPQPTNTPLPTATNTPLPTDTPSPTATHTPQPTNTPVPTSTPNPVITMHIGDLDGGYPGVGGRGWSAEVTILVVDNSGNPLQDATVAGQWSAGTPTAASCVTNVEGICAVVQSGLGRWIRSVTFTVEDVTHSSLTYKPADNTDPDGDSDGTSITVPRS